MPHELGSSDSASPAPVGTSDRRSDRRDRRTVRRVSGFGAMALAVTAVATAGVAEGAGAGSGSSARFAPAADPTPVPAASPAPQPSGAASPAPTAAAPQLKIQIAYDRVGRDLTLKFTFAGYVVEPLAADGTKLTFPTPAKRDIGMGETLSWGDGTNADVPVTGRRCPVDAEPRVVHEIKDAYSVTKKYAAPGTYTINYSYFACGLNGGKISGTLQIVVPK